MVAPLATQTVIVGYYLKSELAKSAFGRMVLPRKNGQLS